MHYKTTKNYVLKQTFVKMYLILSAILIIIIISISNYMIKRSRLGKGHPLESQSQEIILNLKSYFEKEMSGDYYMEDVINSISIATKLSKTSIKKIFSNGIVSPKKSRDRKPKYNYDNCDIMAINTIIRQFYLQGIYPSINDVFTKINSDNTSNNGISFKGCSTSTFYRIVKKMGFKYIKSNKLSRKILMERSDVVMARRKYLRKNEN
jgi:hypothetical protein